MKRRGKSPPVSVATQVAVHLMGCKAKYTVSPQGHSAARAGSGSPDIAGGRLLEAAGDGSPR